MTGRRRRTWSEPSAAPSKLNDGRAVFNIAGNKYRSSCGSIIFIASFMSGSSERTGSTMGSMHKPFEGRSRGYFAHQKPTRLP
jgi:hypothetical protein